MPSIPQFLLGRHLTSVVITPQTVAANGALSDGTAKTMTTVVDSIQKSISPVHEEINAVNSTRANNVLTHDDGSLTLSIIEVNNGGDPDPLEAIVMTNDVFKVVFTKGTATGSTVTWTDYFTRGQCSFGISGRGKQIASLELVQVDAGSSTSTRVVA